MLDGGLSEFVLAKGTCCSQRTSPRQNQSDLQLRGAATRHVLDREQTPLLLDYRQIRLSSHAEHKTPAFGTSWCARSMMCRISSFK
jgi:hypothetical protein